MKDGIIIENIDFSFGKNKKILRNITLRIKKGEFIGISGVNGSGKSTFTYLLNGLIPNSIKGDFRGKVLIDGSDTRKESVSFFAKKVGMVFQNPDYSFFNLTVKEEIEFGLKNLRLDHEKERVLSALKTVGMEKYINHDPQSLSFGEKQKIALACVLAMDTDYIVLDEPSSMLDYKSSCDLYELLEDLNKKGKTIIAVEHDTDFLWKYSDRTIIFNYGEIILSGITKKVLKNKETLIKLGIKIPNYIS